MSSLHGPPQWSTTMTTTTSTGSPDYIPLIRHHIRTLLSINKMLIFSKILDSRFACVAWPQGVLLMSQWSIKGLDHLEEVFLPTPCVGIGI